MSNLDTGKKKHNIIREGVKLMKKKLICLVIALILLSLVSCSEIFENPSTVDQSNTEDSLGTSDLSDNKKGTILIDDDYITVTYLDTYEEAFIEGAFYLKLSIENKSDQEIMVALTDAAVNDVSIFVITGLPVTAQSGEKAIGSYIFTYKQLDIASLDEIKTIEFKVCVFNNETMETLEETDRISLNF